MTDDTKATCKRARRVKFLPEEQMREVTKIVGRLRVVVYVPDSADEADAAALRRIVDAVEREGIASVETGQFSKRHEPSPYASRPCPICGIRILGADTP